MGGTGGKGLERVAFDLHVHTPTSHDWRGGEASPSDLVEHALAVGLDGIALTDHGTGAWVDEVRAAAKGTPLVVFPGVELNDLAGNEGIHLICLFNIDVSASDIERFLTTIGVVRGAGGRLERGSATSGPLEVLDEVRRFGGIAVLAHCQSSRGALGAMRGDLRTKMVQHRAVLAVEAPAEEYYDEEKKARRKRTYDVLDGSDPNYRRELAVYQASDNPSGQGHGHGLTGVGSRFTYFYVEHPLTLESLRQCFVDRSARIEIPAPGATISRRETATPGIARLQVTGGFLDGLDLVFHRGLTTILGAKGAGKSIVVELLRFALDQEPTQQEILKDHETKLAKQLGLYGRVRVIVRLANGSQQAIEREFNPVSGNPYHGITAPPNELLPCHFLSQGEIVRIAESEEEQIRFIDSFFNFRAHQNEIYRIREQLLALDHDVANQIRARKTVASLRAEREVLRTEIAEKDVQLASPAFSKFQQAQTKTHALERAVAAVHEMAEVLRRARTALEAVPKPPAPPAEVSGDPVVRRASELAARAKSSLLAQVIAAIDAAATLSDEGSQELTAWHSTFAAISDEYSREAQRAGGDVPALSQGRALLVAKLTEVETKLNAANQVATLLNNTVTRRNELLAQLSSSQAAYTQARQERCDWFNQKSSGQIRARVAAGSNREAFRERLATMKRGSYLTASEVDAIVDNCFPYEFVNALLRYNLTRNTSDLIAIATVSGLDLTRITALGEFLLSDESGIGYEALLELQYAVTPADRPSIAFRREDDTFAALDELSTGQKCTALLVMALCEGDNPIIVDQPEDSLDIRSIWHDMCLRLRLSKRDRQFIFTTHNSSLAVASDSDKFVVLAANAQHSNVLLAGAIDSEEVRREVVKLLEGGTSTYFLKQRKYNIIDPYAPMTP